MGIHFTCKTKEQPIFRNDLIPGRATAGINGSTGENGTNGPSIHFSDYSPNNDYIKGMIREKIKNNLVLSSGNTISLQGIQYVDGDLILSKDLLVYRLDINGDNIDFTYLGKLTDKQKEAKLVSDENLINSIGEVEFMNFTENVFNIPIPSNRCIDSSASIRLKGCDYTSPYHIEDYPDSSTRITYDKAFKKTFGFSFKPIIHVTDSSILNYWNFYLRIYTKINKSPQYDTYILGDSGYESLMDPVHRNMQGAFEFYKYAEIKLNAKLDGSNTYQEHIDSSSAIYNITDMSCDKLHPAGNNINSNFIHPHNFITKNFWGTPYRYRFGGIDNLHLSWYGLVIGPGSIRTGEKNSTNPAQAENLFSEWSMQQFQTLSYDNLRGYIQYSLYSIDNPNFRSGDSAYFSGMYTNMYPYESFGPVQWQRNCKVADTAVSSTVPYDNFIKHEMILNDKTPLLKDSSTYNMIGYTARLNLEKSYICSRLRSFLLNSENIYELVCVNKKTGAIKIMNTRVKTTT